MNRVGRREPWWSGLRRLVLASSALVALPMLAAAQDATWTGPGTSMLDAANWSTGAVPTGTATFAGALPVVPTIVALTPLRLGEIRFAAGAGAYVVTLGTLGPPTSDGTLRLNGAGITDLSGQASFDLAAGLIVAEGQASLGSVRIASGTNTGLRREIDLQDNARGGTAGLVNVTLSLRGNASAERLTLFGELVARDNATLGDATINIIALNGTTRPSVVAGNASLGAARITIEDGPNNMLRVAQNATGGTAAVTVRGAGQFDLSLMTAPSFTIGSLAGDGRVLIGTHPRFGLIIDGPGGTFGGTFEGGTGTTAEQVIFQTGTYRLTGTSPFSGAYVVGNNGTLIVNGDISAGAQLLAGSGTTLRGTGTLPAAVVGGTLAPGDGGIGTLSVAGRLLYGTQAVTEIEVNPATSAADRINVSAVAVLAGGLQVTSLGAALPTNGQTFTILQASAVQNTYIAVADNLTFFDFTPVYTATQVDLVATQLPFAIPTVTNNVRNVTSQATALDTYTAAVATTPPSVAPPANAGVPQRNSDFDTVLTELLRIPTAAQATNALHSMTGEVYASFTTVGLEQLDRFRYAAFDAAGSCEGRGGEMRGRYCAWADAYYVSASLDGEGDLAGFDYTLGGIQGGVEMRVQPDAVVGFTVGYGEQRMRNFDFASRRLTGDALFAGVYGSYGVGPWQAVGLVGYTRFDVDGERDIAVGSIARQARSNFGADGVNAAVALRYRADLGGFRLEPEVLLAFTQYWQEGFTETGAGSLNLRVNGTDANSFVTGIGVRASTEFTVEGRMVRPFAVLRYEHDWLAGEKEDHRVNASFAAVPEAGSWTVFGQNRGRENLIGRLGVVGEFTSNVALFATAGGQLNSNGTEWGVGGGLRVTF
ncbi:autotransporter outer membrane beta-barrel domain-containing protein [Roseomonas eburnea]|uniref:Autotransporter outer membrane beta-barrel domain-containing protein n=1 Tax=Neoroseomonas eburnea TaxID=1346889 RepID=A0A9X9X5Z0_9PROT|nr:autotransporter outer membrane beta-barrel domain-containing protein [Neoroseomonas eburnea]MBR0679126.1 autotransporter outer membrane beta-barrel domain-containing protein [Neoroseomonas eburnea]